MHTTHRMVRTSATCGLIAIVILVCTIQTSRSAPYPMLEGQSNAYLSENDGDPEVMLELLARLGQSIMRANDLENSKRGLDLGLSRGYSGTQAAKHLMGIAAANFAGGPGRRRRSDGLPKILTP
ncbi:diuretic hormone class 2 [Daktulosphaira vitifoliae]|uniref:diuretic hormone class 2 n=1 Tax=Daktulosphaira vitifoliae TaxID=58002 RepID=UPI0021AA1055|nr:diuretic hormone class 2 [Daktulosphaira vitifoliae]XP_050534786.1 diuretic hormone class 2 [Daktulosphaira vitifoliae]XP_050534787.1 diuretic hormone class 2 [Daktulosphaira vitifoliae]XP_050534788.1 diuretic hormone class 2 [Daktulosphaira vitifoliae]